MENDDGDTILNTTFDAGSSQHHPQTPIHTSSLRCQSTPPQTGTIRMQETTVPAVPAAPQKSTTPCIPLPTSPNSGSHLSQLSAPLFTEDRCSSTPEEELEVDAEVTLINRRNKPNRTFTDNSTTGRPTSTLTTMDYTTQGDPNQVALSTPLMFMSTTTKNQFLSTNNFFIPDGSNRRIHDIRDKVFHVGYLENGNNAYLLELPGLEKMLHTQKFLMDKMSGQFYAVYGNSYQRMSTKPMLQQAWETGELIDQLAAMRQAFGYTKLTEPTPPLINGSPPTASTSCQPDDILSKKPEPKNIQYQPPTFSLDSLTQHLAMEERIQVHHNYISAVSNREHRKDLINRLKRSNPHNIPAYEAEMAHHMAMHDDVLRGILTILKQDDYYRTMEELPVIDNLRAFDDIQLFPELYDTTTIIERVTGEADLIERQLRQPGMYPLPKTPLPSTSGFVPKPTPTFQPIAPDIHQRRLLPIMQTTYKVLKHHQGVQYPLDNRPPASQQALTVHHLNTHHHSRLCLHNLPHYSHLTQATHPLMFNPTKHHNHLSLHNLNSSLLLEQMLTHLPSLSFQLQKHNLCPAHHSKIYPSQQMVKE